MSKFNVKAVGKVQVLVVDDEPSIVDYISETIIESGYNVESYTESWKALEAIKKRKFDLAFIDINMPEVDGVELSRKIMELSTYTEIIIITGAPDEKNLDPCLKMGLTHFLFKPFNESQLVYTAYAALHYKRLRDTNVISMSGAKIKGSGLVGVSMPMQQIRQEIMTIADIDIPVLILGNSGTGKEIVARDLHNNSSRRNKPFLPINCAILGSLAETELFGHVSGAFTGASKSTRGYIGSAQGGTLFLDEVGELPIEVQAKLLRFLDDGEYSRVGEANTRYADIRILAATNRDLETMCNENKFREDLYYRLTGSVITMPSLDERKIDILPLIYHFFELFQKDKEEKPCEITSEAASIIIESKWPGNVRQLKQTLFKITQISPNRKITAFDVRKVLGDGKISHIGSYKEEKQRVLTEFDRDYLMKVLYLARGSLKTALSISAMHKKNFYVKIKQLGLTIKDYSEVSKDNQN